MNDNIISFTYKFDMPICSKEELTKYLEQEQRHKKVLHHAILYGITQKKFYLEMAKMYNRSLFFTPIEVHYDKPLWNKEIAQ